MNFFWEGYLCQSRIFNLEMGICVSSGDLDMGICVSPWNLEGGICVSPVSP